MARSGRLPSPNHKSSVAAPKPQAASQNTTAEAERQRPDLTESSRSESSGHWQRSTHSRPPARRKADVQRRRVQGDTTAATPLLWLPWNAMLGRRRTSRRKPFLRFRLYVLQCLDDRWQRECLVVQDQLQRTRFEKLEERRLELPPVV